MTDDERWYLRVKRGKGWTVELDIFSRDSSAKASVSVRRESMTHALNLVDTIPYDDHAFCIIPSLVEVKDD